MRGSDLGPPVGYPPFRCKNPQEVPTPDPWSRCCPLLSCYPLALEPLRTIAPLPQGLTAPEISQRQRWLPQPDSRSARLSGG